MNSMLTAAVFCIVCCVLLKTISSESPGIKAVCAIAAACIVMMRFLDSFYSISNTLNELFDSAGIDEEYLKIIFKSLGICYVTQIGCDVCRDCGENALASQLELAGKAALLIVSLPLFSAAADIIRSLLLI